MQAEPIKPVNQFVATVGTTGEGAEPDGVHLIFGYLSPPMLLGTPEEIRLQAEALTELPVEVAGRFLLTRARLGELISVLQSVAGQYDAMEGRGPGE